MNITGLRKDELENELIKYVNSYFINLQKWQRVNNIINRMMTTKNPYFIHKHIKDDLHWIFGIDFYVVYLRKKYSNKYNYVYHSHDNYKAHKDYIYDFVLKNKDNILNDNRDVIYQNLLSEYNIFFIMQEKIVIGFIITVQIYLIYFGGDLFRTYGLTAKEFFIILIMALSVWPVDALRKIMLKKLNKERSV